MEELDEVVHYAWYLFCYKILQGVNHNWVSAMDDKNLLKKLPVFNYVLLSDLVLAVWIVYTHFEVVKMKLDKNLKANAEKTSYFAGIDVQKKKSGREKGLKTGKHISKTELPWYTKLYEEFRQPFENDQPLCIKWNKIFWKQMMIHNETYKKVSCPQEKQKRKRKRHYDDIDVPDCDPPAMQIENDDNDSVNGGSDNGSFQGGENN